MTAARKGGSNPRTLRCTCGFSFRLFPSAIEECERGRGVHCPKCLAKVRTREPVSEEAAAMIAAAVAHCVDRAPEVRKWAAQNKALRQEREAFFARKREEFAAMTGSGDGPRTRASDDLRTLEREVV